MKSFLIPVFLILFLQTPCKSQDLVLFSKTSKNSNYEVFIKKADPTLELKSAYGQPSDSIQKWLKNASGIIITGGEDVYPGIYGEADEINKCGTIDRYRDSLEIAMILFAKENKTPLLGICRGEQILNVCMGGTLHTDIPSDIPNHVTHRNKIGAKHDIIIDKHSLLYTITKVTGGEVNSYHHQCVDRLAEGFVISARSKDGVPEAIEPVSDEWTVLGLQYHPEKMDFSSPLAGPVAEWFVWMIK